MCNEYGNSIPCTLTCRRSVRPGFPCGFLVPHRTSSREDSGDRRRPGDPASGAWHPVRPIALVLATCETEGCTDHHFRSAGRRFPVARCLVPASHFFEFTGQKSSKSKLKWKFTKLGEPWFCMAGLWQPTPRPAPVTKVPQTMAVLGPVGHFGSLRGCGGSRAPERGTWFDTCTGRATKSDDARLRPLGWSGFGSCRSGRVAGFCSGRKDPTGAALLQRGSGRRAAP